MRLRGSWPAPISTRPGTPTVTANYTSNIGLVSGNAFAFESLESSFQQDLNHDGQIGPPTTVIEANGSTQLTEVGNHFFLYDNGSSGPSLKFAGADFVDGQFGAWAPIGAEKTATGYEVAWKDASTGLYTAWNTDKQRQLRFTGQRPDGPSVGSRP